MTYEELMEKLGDCMAEAMCIANEIVDNTDGLDSIRFHMIYEGTDSVIHGQLSSYIEYRQQTANLDYRKQKEVAGIDEKEERPK